MKKADYIIIIAIFIIIASVIGRKILIKNDIVNNSNKTVTYVIKLVSKYNDIENCIKVNDLIYETSALQQVGKISKINILPEEKAGVKNDSKIVWAKIGDTNNLEISIEADYSRLRLLVGNKYEFKTKTTSLLRNNYRYKKISLSGEIKCIKYY